MGSDGARGQGLCEGQQQFAGLDWFQREVVDSPGIARDGH
jgi:hypothetical protein